MFNLAIVPVRLGELPSIPSLPDTVSPEPQAQTEADFMTRLDRMVATAEARKASREPSPSPLPPQQSPPGREPDPDKPDLSQPGALTGSLRAMGSYVACTRYGAMCVAELIAFGRCQRLE